MLGEMESDVLPFKRAGTVRLPRLTHAPVILTRFLPRHGLCTVTVRVRAHHREHARGSASARPKRNRPENGGGGKRKRKSERRPRTACHLPPIQTAANELRSGRPIPNNASRWWVDARQAARDYRRDRFLAQGGAKKTAPNHPARRVGRGERSLGSDGPSCPDAASEKWAPGTERACLAQQLICHCAHGRAWLVTSSLKDGSRRLCAGSDRRRARREASSRQRPQSIPVPSAGAAECDATVCTHRRRLADRVLGPLA